MNLGKLLVKELELEPSVDTLQRWMAHYIAEQILLAESTTGDEQRHAQLRCFEIIIDLWKERSSLPDGSRPLEKFENIWDTLEKIDPENKRPFYTHAKSYDSPETNNDVANMWLDLASHIDYAARSLIEYSLRKSAVATIDKSAVNWLVAAHNIDDDMEIDTIVRLTLGSETTEGNEKTDAELELEKLNSFKEHLEALLSTSTGILSFIDEKIVELQKEE